MKRLLTQCLLLLPLLGAAPVLVGAQVQGDSLAGVEVRGASKPAADAKAAFLPGAIVVAIDSGLLQQYRQQSMAVLLSQVSSVFVKSYGFNSLATLNFRGASAAQSAVYWEGVPLMNGGTGITDISMIPVSFSDSVSMQYGGSGALGGSGNVGGALLLQSRRPAFPAAPRWQGEVRAGWGSYSQVPINAAIGYQSSRLALSARAIYMRAENHFGALDEYGQPFTVQHAALRGIGVMADATYKASSRDAITVRLWRQAYEREIPRALFESSSEKVQNDDALRLMLHWTHSAPRANYYLKAAFIRDGFRYEDPAVGLRAAAVSRHFFGEWGIQGRWGHSASWLIFTPVQYITLDGTNAASSQLRAAVAGSMKKDFLNGRLSVAANGRGEVIDQKLIGLPGVGLSYRLRPTLLLRGSVQRSYRVPTLQELYYEPGGNTALRPERGWSAEGGYELQKAISANVYLKHSAAGYDRHIRDWIIWLGGAIWTPHNLAAVRSRGIETENEIGGSRGSLQWRLSLSAAYTRSTPTESYLANDNSIGRQIPYVPRLTGSGIASVTWRGAVLTYVHSYAGTRFITADESARLRPYSTGNIMLGYAVTKARLRMAWHGTIQNVWNSRYAVVAYRPMPGANYLVSMALSRN